MKVVCISTLFLWSILPGDWASAQNLNQFRYFYDDSAQLFRVLDSTGTLIEYIYDPSGNIIQTNRSTIAPGSLSILNITPLTGGPGDTLRIFGQNFSTNAASDIVKINGVAATVISASATQIVIRVPPGIASGQITVTVNGVTVGSGPSLIFTPAPVPVINSLTPDGALAGTSLPNVAVAGTDLTGAIFTFPLGAAAVTKTTGPNSATVQITALNERGAFPLVATTGAGSSTGAVTAGNHFIVMISPDESDGRMVSILNTAAPANGASDPTNVSNQAASRVVSVLNTVLSNGPDPTNVSNQAASRVVSVLNPVLSSNGPDPTNISNEADSFLVSLLNQGGMGPHELPAGAIRSAAIDFATPFARVGTLEVSEPGAAGGVVGGRTLTIAVRVPSDAREVELQANGVSLLRSTQYPHVFTFNVPVNAREIDFKVVATDEQNLVLASASWIQPILADAGTSLRGRVIDSQGLAVPGARLTVEAAGLYAEFFDLRSRLSDFPDLGDRRPVGASLVSELAWVNPHGAFGDGAIALGLVPGYAVRYSSRLLVPQDGNYKFVTRAQSETRLTVDGRSATGSVALSTGEHSIELMYYQARGSAELQLNWVPPGGAEQPVPAEVLRASDPVLEAVSGADGSFAIPGVPSKVAWLRVLARFPDGRTAASAWQVAVDGGVTPVGDIVLESRQ